MFYLLELREKIKKFYQEKEGIAIAIAKFMLSFAMFYITTKSLDYNSLLGNPLIVLILALIGAFVPTAIIAFLIMAVASFEVFYFSPILGAVVAVVLIIIYCLFIRFTPKLGLAVVAVPLAFVLKMPCLIPIILGIIATPVSAVAVICGTILYYLFSAIVEVEKIVGDMAGQTDQVYVYLVKELKENQAMLFTIIVFAFITLMVYVIRTREIDYAPEMAIVTGGIVDLLVFLVADLTDDIEMPFKILGLILGTIGTVFITFIVQYFRCALDYSTIEKVQFEDDDYFYYVKAVPKMKIATKQNDVKKIQVQKPVAQKTEDGFSIGDVFQDKNWDTIDGVDSDFTVVADKMETADIDVDREYQEKIERDLEKSLEKDLEKFDEKR
jgi:hypothetical protein